MVEYEIVKSFFPDLEETVIHDIADTMVEQTLKRGTILIQEGERDIWVVFVVSGILKGVRSLDKGGEVIECIQMAGDIFFAGASFTEECTAASSMQASTDSVVYLMPKETAHKFVASNLNLMLLMSNILTRNAAIHRDLHVAVTSMGVKARYLWFLKTYPGAADIMKQYEIASLLGVTPEHLSSTIRAVRAEMQNEENPAGGGTL